MRPCPTNCSGASIHEKYSSRTFPRLPIQGHRRFGLMRVFGSSRHPLRASSISSLQTFRASYGAHAHAATCVSMRSVAISSEDWQCSDSRRCRCAAGLQRAPSRARAAGGRWRTTPSSAAGTRQPAPARGVAVAVSSQFVCIFSRNWLRAPTYLPPFGRT